MIIWLYQCKKSLSFFIFQTFLQHHYSTIKAIVRILFVHENSKKKPVNWSFQMKCQKWYFAYSCWCFFLSGKLFPCGEGGPFWSHPSKACSTKSYGWSDKSSVYSRWYVMLDPHSSSSPQGLLVSKRLFFIAIQNRVFFNPLNTFHGKKNAPIFLSDDSRNLRGKI